MRHRTIASLAAGTVLLGTGAATAATPNMVPNPQYCLTFVNHLSGTTYQVAERNWTLGGIAYSVTKAGDPYRSGIFSDHTTYDVGVGSGTPVSIHLSGNAKCLPRTLTWSGNNSLGLVGYTTRY